LGGLLLLQLRLQLRLLLLVALQQLQQLQLVLVLQGKRGEAAAAAMGEAAVRSCLELQRQQSFRRPCRRTTRSSPSKATADAA